MNGTEEPSGVDNSEPGSSLQDQNLNSVPFGGARPKVNHKPRDSIKPRNSANTRTEGLSKDYLEQVHLSKRESPLHRRKREFHRTNSSDSVLMFVNNGNDNVDYFSGLQSRTERSSLEDWDPRFSAETSDPRCSDWDPRSSTEPRDFVPVISDPVGTYGHGLSSTNSTVSMTDAKSDDPSDVETFETMEDDCYIYTYKGGTAYLSADLPTSFFRLDSGSDGESLPGQ